MAKKEKTPATTRTEYKFQITDPAAAEQTIQNFFQANKLKGSAKNGETYYTHTDLMLGNLNVKYSIADNILTLTIWISSGYREFALESGYSSLSTFLTKEYYIEMLLKLFSDLQVDSRFVADFTAVRTKVYFVNIFCNKTERFLQLFRVAFCNLSERLIF